MWIFTVSPSTDGVPSWRKTSPSGKRNSVAPAATTPKRSGTVVARETRRPSDHACSAGNGAATATAPSKRTSTPCGNVVRVQSIQANPSRFW